MWKMHLTLALAGIIAILAVLGGCSAQNTPKDTVFRFVKATRLSDRAEFEKTVLFERLIVDTKGEAYLAMPVEKRNEELLEFKRKLLDNLTAGKLSIFDGIDPELREERVTGDEAEVKISDRKNKDIAFVFMLARSDGAWKIYKVGKI